MPFSGISDSNLAATSLENSFEVSPIKVAGAHESTNNRREDETVLLPLLASGLPLFCLKLGLVAQCVLKVSLILSDNPFMDKGGSSRTISHLVGVQRCESL
jgi:hypothetical protein